MDRRDKSGFTLIEIMVALVIVGLVMGLALGRMNRSLDRNMKKTSSQLSSVIRYLYSKSAMEGVYIRLVLDTESQSYWVEATSGPFVLERDEDILKSVSAVQKARSVSKKALEQKSKSAKKDKKEAKEGSLAEQALEEKQDEDKRLKPPEPKFSAVDSKLLHATKFPDNVFFKDVWVEHKSSPIEGGKAEIYFFPNGYVEHAIINLRDKDDEKFFSIETEPSTGRVDIENEYRRLSGE